MAEAAGWRVHAYTGSFGRCWGVAGVSCGGDIDLVFWLVVMAMARRRYQFQCGEHAGVVVAASVGAAWRKLTRGKTKGFAVLARFCIDRPGEVWCYMTPRALDRCR
jgi:hypothetical protein